MITDETSHYGRTFSHVRNMQSTLNKLVKAGENWSAGNFDQTKNFRDNFHDLIAKSKQAAIVAEYSEREAFIDTMLMFEQVAKKEAQAQFFKVKKDAGKLIGNISDVSQFLFGVDIAQRVAQGQSKFKDVARYEALKEVVKLSCLVNFPRWDINAKNLAQVGDTAVDIKVEQFRRSINSRSYGHLAPKLSDQPPPNDAFGKPKEEKLPKDHAEWPRVHLEWALIDDTIAQQRLDDFREGMNPIWEFIRGQGAYFTAADALSDVLQKKQDPKQARAAVRAELVKVLDLLTNLKDQVAEDARKEFLDFLAGQVQESCEFWVLRDGKGKEIAAKKKKLADEAKTFESTLPLDLAKRSDWKMTDAAKHDDTKFQYLVAGVSGSGADDAKRTKNPDLFKKAVVRMNLVDQDHQEAYALGGFVFEVPPDTIYLAGAGLKTGLADVAKPVSGQDTFKTMIKAAADTARGQAPNLALPTPAAVLAATKAGAFNEVFVAGTSLDEASAVKPVAVYVTIDVDTKNDGNQSSPLAKPVLEALSKIADERRLPVIHLYRKDPAPRASPPFATERQS